MKKFFGIALLGSLLLQISLLASLAVQQAYAASITITSPTSTSNVSAGPITVTGTAEPSKNVKLYANNVLMGTGKVGNDGKWSINTTLTSNANTLRADLYDDPAGYLNDFSGPTTLTKFDATTNAILNTVPAGLSGPIDIKFHPTLARAYVLDNKNATVAVIDTDTRKIVTSIDLGTYQNAGAQEPTSMAISPDGSKLYVSISDQSKVVAINTSDNTVATSATVGSAPSRLAVSPDGSKVYVVDGSNLLVRNATTLVSSAAIDMTNACYGIVMDSTHNKAFVNCDDGSGNGVIVPVALSDNSLGTPAQYTVSVHASDDLAMKPDNSSLYISDNNDNEVVILNPSDLSSVDQISGVDHAAELAFKSDGSKLYVSTDAGTNVVHSINTTTKVVSDIDVITGGDDGSELHIAAGPSGGNLYVSRQLMSEVEVFSTSSDTSIDDITADYNGYSIAITNDGTAGYITGVQFHGTKATLTKVNLVNNTVEWSIPMGGRQAVGVALNKDETKAYVAASEDGSGGIKVVDLATHTIIKSISDAGGVYAVVGDPLHNKIFSADFGGTGVHVIDTSTDTKVADISTGSGLQGITGMDISPDNSRLYAYGFNDSGDHNLYVVDTATNSLLATKAMPDPNDSTFDVLVNNAGTKVYIAVAGAQKIDVYDVGSGAFDPAIATGEASFGLGITPDDSKLFATNLNSQAVTTVNLSDNSLGSFDAPGNSSAFGNFIAQTLLASTSVTVSPNGGSLANTGQRLLTIPLLVIIAVSSCYLWVDRRRHQKTSKAN